MQTTLLQRLLSAQKAGYVIVNHHLTVLDYGGESTVFIDNMPLSLLDLIPELNSCEDILQDVLNGVLPRFELENINRIMANDEIFYLTLSISCYVPTTQLLIILADTSAWAHTQQIIAQQHNELKLLKHKLIDTNHRLEYLLRHYVPREVGKALMEKKLLPELGGQEREITVLFADLRNYTSISEKLTPNETIEMLHVCLDIAATAIIEKGGVVVNFMGDAVMAIFNAPEEQAEHALCAVQAGLNIQAKMVEFYQKTPEKSSPSIYFGVGINTGIALVGNIGAQWLHQYTAVGDSINVASRICSYARPGEVLIGPNTYTYISNRVTTFALPPMKFKGKSQEITIYQVTAINCG